VKKLDPIAAPLRVQDATDVLTGFGFDQRDLKTQHLLEVTVKPPVENPRRLNSEYCRGLVVGSLELSHARFGAGWSRGNGE
jgi:hypothetical protein